MERVTHSLAAVLAALVILISQDIYAQSQNAGSLTPTVIPPSPEAMAMGKYGNTPVGLSTGIPNINIPLYTIKQGSLEVPISASYMASGVKVSEIPSWVGLGWTLNANGVVTRSVVGKSDDLGFWYNQSRDAEQVYVFRKIEWFRERKVWHRSINFGYAW